MLNEYTIKRLASHLKANETLLKEEIEERETFIKTYQETLEFKNKQIHNKIMFISGLRKILEAEKDTSV